MKTRKKNKTQADGNEDSIVSIGEELQPIPGGGGGGGSSGSSPAKALLSKVKELGSKNHKKLRRFSFSTKPTTQSDDIGGGNVNTSSSSPNFFFSSWIQFWFPLSHPHILPHLEKRGNFLLVLLPSQVGILLSLKWGNTFFPNVRILHRVKVGRQNRNSPANE